MRHGRTTAALVLALSGVALAACTGTSAGSGGSGAGADGAGGGVAASAAQTERDSASLAGATPSNGAAGGGATDAATRLAPQLILTGSLSVVVGSVDTAAARAETIAASAGGRTDADDRNAARGSRPTAELTLRVPNSSVPSVLNQVAGLGHETGRRLSTRDVTSDVADVASRVASARSAISSLRALYTRATKVGDIIRIESTLAEREASLESLEARQRSLAGQVALASITVDLTQRKAAAPVVHHTSRGGFVGGLENGWHAFVTTVGGLAVGLGAALPFLLVLALLGVGGFALRRRARRRPTPEPGTDGAT